jgi:hypothetical protein
MHLTETAALLGMILGTAGFVMSLMNYLRDRPRVVLDLQWDMTNSQTGEILGLTQTSNVGRRPVFICVVALQLPKGFPLTHLVLIDSLHGAKLSEGDKPMTHIINYQGLSPYSAAWRKIRAYAEDSTGKKYYSDYPKAKAKAPSWVKEQ